LVLRPPANPVRSPDAICPAKPKRQNVIFFDNHHEAEKAGYRPCLRCRPESAPQSPVWIGKSAVVKHAVKVINSGQTIEFDEDKFADLFGVTARHLRRLFIAEIAKS
jgi:AraC family transcriptional regulator, regulatory protein of adaptative response / DNA-3-methyladenine glycosylase II